MGLENVRISVKINLGRQQEGDPEQKLVHGAKERWRGAWKGFWRRICHSEGPCGGRNSEHRAGSPLVLGEGQGQALKG